MTTAEQIARLAAENSALRQDNQMLCEQVQGLLVRVHQLEGQVGKDSHNSHKPPSSDGPARRPKSLRVSGGKKPGGQLGHRGRTLQLSAAPDQVVVLHPATCAHCQAAIRLRVTEYQAEQVGCPSCQQVTVAPFPPQVAGRVQYGPQVRALALYLLEYQLLPYERTAQMLAEAVGCALSPGTLETWVQQAAHGLAAPEAAIKTALVRAAVLGNDETGLRVAGQRQWLHVARTDQLTHYGRHPKRGKTATDALGILPTFRGTSVHDGLSSYPHYAQCQHALCNAHLLRELTFVAEHEQQAWAQALKAHLLHTQAQVEAARTAGAHALSAGQRTALVARYHALVAQGLAAQPPPGRTGKNGRVKQSPAKNLLDRLQRHADQVLRFLDDFAVPFTNNGAEQDLRMAKIQQKISGTFRSEAGADAFCRIRGYLSTMAKQGYRLLAVLRRVFTDQPLSPVAKLAAV
jgi:transposase